MCHDVQISLPFLDPKLERAKSYHIHTSNRTTAWRYYKRVYQMLEGQVLLHGEPQ